MAIVNPYDAVPYKSFPIEWTAPERLAVASLLHSGPRPALESYRMLELGCGDGANLLPLAYYRKHASFLGIDAAQSRIDVATKCKAKFGIDNIDFINADFRVAARHISGQFDFIVAHGVFSWVPNAVRDALLGLCAKRLRAGGLLYLNYNTRPGWNVRGLVREFLLAQTARMSSLQLRAQLAQEISAKLCASLTSLEHPYSQLMAREFQFVCEHHVSYVAHEYFASENHPYWRSEFLALARRYELEYVADADFNYRSGQIPDELVLRLETEHITGRALEDTVDLLCYRQLHSPILTKGVVKPQPPDVGEFAKLLVASCLTPFAPNDPENPMFQHPSGYHVEAKTEAVRTALRNLWPQWPRGLRVGAVFSDVGDVMNDLKLLHHNGLIELRCIEPGDFGFGNEPLAKFELEGDGYVTTPYHTVEAGPPLQADKPPMSLFVR